MQVPVGKVFSVTRPMDVPSTSLGFAIVFTLLSTCALTISSFHIWECYRLGCQIVGSAAPAPWKTTVFVSYVITFVVMWFGSHVHNQRSLRIKPFHLIFGESWIEFVFWGLCAALTGTDADPTVPLAPNQNQDMTRPNSPRALYSASSSASCTFSLILPCSSHSSGASMPLPSRPRSLTRSV